GSSLCCLWEAPTVALRPRLWSADRRRIFFFNDTATPEIYTLSLHDALPISHQPAPRDSLWPAFRKRRGSTDPVPDRSEEHTSELQSRGQLVCRLLLEKKPQRRPVRRAGGDPHVAGRRDQGRPLPLAVAGGALHPHAGPSIFKHFEPPRN